MRKFLVKINAYQYHATFEVFAEDNVKSIEDSIVDKLGDKSINWEYLGEMNDPKINRITYEEVIDGQRPIQTKRSLELRWQLEYEQEGKYTLDMVKIDNAIRDVITEIKLEESKIADRENAIVNAAPQVSVAT